MYTLGEAARASGKSKPTITKAIRTGRISAVRAEDGTYQIDESELHRVYPMIGQPNGKILRSLTPGDTGITGGNPAAGELEKWKAVAAEREETIRDLRHRLDQADTDRRQVLDRLAAAQERVTALLTDQRPAPAAPPPPAPRHWWNWRRQG
jgi:hypothetical protein